MNFSIRLATIAIAAATISLSGCKKQECKDEWPEGFAFYDLTSGDSEAVCTTPLIKAWNFQTPAGNKAQYQLEITPQQGVAVVTLFASLRDKFESNMVLADEAPQNGELTELIEVVCDQRWYNNNLEYWYMSEASCTISEVTSADEISLVLEYTIYNAGDPSETESYRVELTDYPLTYLPK